MTRCALLCPNRCKDIVCASCVGKLTECERKAVTVADGDESSTGSA